MFSDDDDNVSDNDEPADSSGPTRPTRPGIAYAVRAVETPLTLMTNKSMTNCLVF